MTTTLTPRRATTDLTSGRELPAGSDERFCGYGVMGIAFSSGHYLALRDMTASSIGPAYRAVWHRDATGAWTFHSTVEPGLSCARYFGPALTHSETGPIDLTWQDDTTLDVHVADLSWRITLARSTATRTMTTMAQMMPSAAWSSDSVLAAMGPMARIMLRSGRISLTGTTPAGQHYRAAPLRVWRVVDSTATEHDVDLGRPEPLTTQIRLGDFWLPQRGLFFAGRARFTPSG
ncbi:hypothetical protein [Gordonia sp. NPDC003376]